MMNTLAIQNDYHVVSGANESGKKTLGMVFGALLISVSTMIPAVASGVWFAHATLSNYQAALRLPAASAGCILSMMFIPFIYQLATTGSLKKLLAGVAACSFVLGVCMSF